MLKSNKKSSKQFVKTQTLTKNQMKAVKGGNGEGECEGDASDSIGIEDIIAN